MWEEAVSSNINEVIRAVLNPFFYKKILHAPKAQNHKNSTKQKHKNANKQSKIKNKLKKGGKVTYSLICVSVLFVRAKKRKKSPQC